MSVTDVKPRIERDGQLNEDGTRDYTRRFLVFVDSTNDGQETVLAAGELPARYSPHPDNPKMKALSKRCTTWNKHRKIWAVDVPYSDRVAEDQPEGDDQQSDDPLQEPIEVDWESETVQFVPPGEINTEAYEPGGGTKVAYDAVFNTSAGEPYDPQPTIEEERPTLVITKNHATFDPKLWFAWAGVVNSADWEGAAKHTLKFRIPRSTRGNKNGKKFFRITYRFSYNWRTWDLILPNVGTYYLDGGDKKSFLTGDDQPYLGILNAAGEEFQAGVDDADEAFRTFDGVFAEKNFAALGLGDLAQLLL